MIELTALHTALLDLGLEDWIPLPEAVETVRFEGLVGGDESVSKISRALVDLLGRIAFRYGVAHGRLSSPRS